MRETSGAATGVTLDDLRRRRTEILELVHRHGVTGVWVIGSVARGDNDVESDIDLLVDVEDGTSLMDLAGLYRALCDVLGHEVDLLTRSSLKPRIRERALGEAVAL